MIQKQEAIHTFCENLNDWLHRRGMDQCDLARSIYGDEIRQSHRNRISKLCLGRLEPGVADLRNLSRVLGCSIDTLLSKPRGRKRAKTTH